MSSPSKMPEKARSKASLAELPSIFGRFGNITFGGGSATIAVLHREIVSKRNWISEEIFALCYALSRVTPGTNLLAFETGVGWIVRGWLGAIISLVAGSLPCSVVAVLVTFRYESFSQNVLVARAIRGALAATVGLMLVTAIQLLRPHISKQAIHISHRSGSAVAVVGLEVGFASGAGTRNCCSGGLPPS